MWTVLTTNDGLASWLCLRADVEPVVGGRYELFWNPDPARPESDSTIGCRVLAIDRPRLVRFTWRGSDAVAGVMNAPGAPVTEVEIHLFPTLDGTRLELTHCGWGDGPGWEGARVWFDRAWNGALQGLRKMLAASSPQA
ncbi:MAG: SRPBCC domain-containing protein [Deltaproteobacteria bacterium]|nr:SRPBCC domain-containing protein [Deltaproteobacteria bacterium]